ncbi:diaminopimelate decarboxylase [Paracoccaceae bacterium]|nr:diaminopimelate decarboxylase [Paracoccaceae bacterium]
MNKQISYKLDKLFVEDVAVSEITNSLRTPFYVYSRTAIEENFGRFKRSLKGLDSIICYSVKANSNLSVLETIGKLGGGADVVSLGEYKRALRAGIDPKKIVFSGVGKQDFEIAEMLQSSLLQFNIESVSELEMINKIAISLNKQAPIAFRVNPDIDAGTHENISTGKADNKFGIPIDDAKEIYQYASKLAKIKIVGIDVHIGSQISDLNAFRQTFEHLEKLIYDLKNINIKFENIDIGGGLGIKYTDNDLEPDLQEYGTLVKQILGNLNCRIIFEPGRYIVANSGILVTKVLHKKKSQNKSFLITDAGMNDFSRTALYGAAHRLIPLSKEKSGETQAYDVVGPVCETTDTFLKNYLVEKAEAGDFFAFLDVGAYGAVLSSEYNTRPLVPEIMVYKQRFEIVRSRPTYDEIFDKEAIPNWK